MKFKFLTYALLIWLCSTALVVAQAAAPPTDNPAILSKPAVYPSNSNGQVPGFKQSETTKLANLWIDMGLNPDLIAWFNQNARPNDIARADHVRLIDLLAQVRVGRRLVVFKSVVDAEALMPHISDKLDIIGYNLEHGPANRPDEQEDPVGSVQQMRALADRYHKELALGPDHSFVLNDGAAMAPYVDLFVLQVQKVQTEPATVRDFVEPVVRQLRRANPMLKISIQVRTEGDVAALGNLLESLETDLDGVSILTSPETVTVAQALWQEVRRERTGSPFAEAETMTTTNGPQAGSPGLAAPTPQLPSWFCNGGAAVVGMVGVALFLSRKGVGVGFISVQYSKKDRQ